MRLWRKCTDFINKMGDTKLTILHWPIAIEIMQFAINYRILNTHAGVWIVIDAIE